MRPWVQIGRQRRSHAWISERAKRAASGFVSLGVGPGDVVAVCMRNDFPIIEAAMGAAMAGAYVTPVNWHNSPAEINYVLENSQAKVLVIHSDLLARFADGIPAGLRLLVEDPNQDIAEDYGVVPAVAGGAGLALADTWSAWLESFPPHEGPYLPPLGSMIYTSGTTGRPKAVKRDRPTPEQVKSTFDCYTQVYGAYTDIGSPAEIVALAAGPMYHAAPFAYMNYYFRLGANFISEPKFQPERLLRLIEQERVTHLLAVPTMFVRLLALEKEVRDRYDVGSLKFVMHGAAPCAPHVKQAMIDWWGPVICEHYGGTETGVLTFCDAHEWLAKPGTVGRVMPDTRLRVIDDQGRDCPPRMSGDIIGRRMIFPNFTYFGDDAKRRSVEHDGLFSLGDRGYFDEDGYLFLDGRSSDMIISGGVNIYPQEIEAELVRAPGVADCAVFGVPDEEFGERVYAVLQPKAGATIEPDSVRQFLRERLAGYKVPQTIEVRDTLPREDSGKIFKRKLRDPFWAGTGRQI